MIFNFRSLIIKICIFVIGFFITVQIAMVAFAPIVPESVSMNESSDKANTTVISNGVNSASSPVRYNAVDKPKSSSDSLQANSESSNGFDTTGMFPTLLAIIGIAGVLFYISRPTNKEWLPFEI